MSQVNFSVDATKQLAILGTLGDIAASASKERNSFSTAELANEAKYQKFLLDDRYFEEWFNL